MQKFLKIDENFLPTVKWKKLKFSTFQNHEDGYLTGLDNLVQLMEEEATDMNVNIEACENETDTRTETTT